MSPKPIPSLFLKYLNVAFIIHKKIKPKIKPTIQLNKDTLPRYIPNIPISNKEIFKYIGNIKYR